MSRAELATAAIKPPQSLLPRALVARPLQLPISTCHCCAPWLPLSRPPIFAPAKLGRCSGTAHRPLSSAETTTNPLRCANLWRSRDSAPHVWLAEPAAPIDRQAAQAHHPRAPDCFLRRSTSARPHGGADITRKCPPPLLTRGGGFWV